MNSEVDDFQIDCFDNQGFGSAVVEFRSLSVPDTDLRFCLKDVDLELVDCEFIVSESCRDSNIIGPRLERACHSARQLAAIEPDCSIMYDHCVLLTLERQIHLFHV